MQVVETPLSLKEKESKQIKLTNLGDCNKLSELLLCGCLRLISLLSSHIHICVSSVLLDKEFGRIYAGL